MAMKTKTKTKMRVDPTKLYIAWQSIAGDVDGVPYAVERGAKLPGSHPLVRHAGAGAFVPDGTLPADWPTIYDVVVEMGESEPPAPPPPPRIAADTPLSQLFVCVAGILNSDVGSCAEGTIVRRDDPRIAVASHCFEPLIEHLDV
jgi:hypothetical protein